MIRITHVQPNTNLSNQSNGLYEVIFVHQSNGVVEIYDCGGFQNRNSSTIRLLKRCYNKFTELKKKNIEFYIYTGDAPRFIHKRLPVLTYANIASNLNYCIPDFIFDCWKEVGIHNYSETVKKIVRSSKVPFAHSKLFWIGASTNKTRVQFVNNFSNHPKINCNLIQWNEAYKPMSWEDHCMYQYLIDLPGVGYSGRIKGLLFTQRLLFIVERHLVEYYHNNLKPFSHFIPIKEDLSDLEQWLNWADRNQDKVYEISKSAFNFAVKNLSADNALERMFEVINKL